MGGKGGSSIDTSGLEAATNKAIDLQKEIYDVTREDVQPWYQMGTGAVNRLSDLLGISGGSVLDRGQVYNDLKDQYTTQTKSPPAGDNALFIDPSTGNVIAYSGIISGKSSLDPGRLGQIDTRFEKSPESAYALLNDFGFQSAGDIGGTTQSVTDVDALNAAVDERMADQSVPDDYGSLLERFDLTKFEEDPGYAFRQQESQKALERAMAAQGVTLGGGGYGEINPQVARALEEQSQGLAAQEYGNAYNRYVQDQLNIYNMLTGAAGMGQGSTGILATGGQNYANNVGNLTTGLASAQLNAQMQNQASGGSMFGSLLGAGAGALLGNPGFGASIGGALFG